MLAILRWLSLPVALTLFGVGSGFAQTPRPLVTHDLDGDGGHDLIFHGRPGTAVEGFVRLQRLDGLVPGDAAFPPTAGGTFALVGAGDLDGDGRDDLVTQVPLPTGGFELRAYFTGADGVSVVAGPTSSLTNPDWRLGAIGRSVLFQFAKGPGAVALFRPYVSGGTLYELLLFGVRHYATLDRYWIQFHQRAVTATPPAETIGLVDVNADGWPDALIRFAGGCWVERALLMLPIRCGPAFWLASAGDVDGDGRTDLIYEGVAGTPAAGMLRIDHSGPTGFADQSGWVPTGGGVWELF